MPVKTLKEYLDNQNINYVTVDHAMAYCAQEIAATAHIPGKEMAKTVMVKVDGVMAMAVLPACYNVDFNLLKNMVGAKKIELASEKEFKDKFPDCEAGAMPPFGNLYGMDVFVAEPLTHVNEISFNSGSHSELMRLAYKDFERLVKPRVGNFSS